MIINLLAMALLVFSATQAGAYRMWLAPTTPTTVNPSDTVTVQLHLDTQGQSNITIMTAAILYDTTKLTYLAASSSAAGTYILYAPSVGTTPSTWLEPKVPAPSTVSYNPPLEVIPGGVVAGWIEPNLKATAATTADLVIDTLVFHAMASDVITLAVGPVGTAFQLGDFTQPPMGTGAPVVVTVIPEPTTAVLIGLGLLGLGVAGRRSKA